MCPSSIMYLHGNSVFDQHRSQLSVQLEEDLSLAGLVQVTQRQCLDVEGLPSLQLHLRWETVREVGECEGGRGQKLDYVRKLKLIHRGLAHKSSWSNKKRLQSSVKLKKRGAGGVRQAQCFLLFLISFNPQAGLECFPACTWRRAQKHAQINE